MCCALIFFNNHNRESVINVYDAVIGDVLVGIRSEAMICMWDKCSQIILKSYKWYRHMHGAMACGC